MDIDDIPIYSPIDKRVCTRCVSDPILAELVEAQLDDEVCSYCGALESAPMEYVLDAVCEAIAAEYTDPAEELPYETREGGYQGVVEDGPDLVWDVVGDWIDNETLLIDLAEAFAGTFWCRRDYFGLDDYEILDCGWKRFVDQIKHKTRYLFLQELKDPADPHARIIPPGRMLEALGELLRQFALYRELRGGFTFYRARVHDPTKRLTTPDELGPPPRELASVSNRMSPAGIPMFYGALDERTAIAETFDPSVKPGQVISVAAFVSDRPLFLLDLTELPSLPSPFDKNSRYLRKPILFLREFVSDLAKPIQRDGFEHVEYVPTQVVTEFIRHRFMTDGEHAMDGIQYRSSRPGGGTSVVLFLEREYCGPRERGPFDPEIVLTLEGVVRRRPEDT